MSKIQVIHKTVVEKSPAISGEILKCIYLMDALLSHEATEEDLWMKVKQHNWSCMSHDNDNMMDVEGPKLIHTTHIHTVCNFRRSSCLAKITL